MNGIKSKRDTGYDMGKKMFKRLSLAGTCQCIQSVDRINPQHLFRYHHLHQKGSSCLLVIPWKLKAWQWMLPSDFLGGLGPRCFTLTAERSVFQCA